MQPQSHLTQRRSIPTFEYGLALILNAARPDKRGAQPHTYRSKGAN
jgi:hypothetical protein